MPYYFSPCDKYIRNFYLFDKYNHIRRLSAYIRLGNFANFTVQRVHTLFKLFK